MRGCWRCLHAVIPHVHLVAEDSGLRSRELRRVYLVAFGLILHDFPEGFAMANAYLSAPAARCHGRDRDRPAQHPRGVRHGAPRGDGPPPSLPDRRGSSVRCSGPAGALIGLAVVSISPGLNAVFLAFAAGAMVFVAVHELIPLSRELGRRRDTVVGIAAGTGVVVLLGLLATA